MMRSKSPVPATSFTQPCNAKPAVMRCAEIELANFHFVQPEGVGWITSR
jgi:hypothetical protein